MDTSERYRWFGERETRGQSATYERLALAVAGDPELLALIDALPQEKQQPNLLFAAVRYLDGPVGDPWAFREWTVRQWKLVSATMLTRRTQTNEPGRCAVLLPVLAGLAQPLALLEVGASAGLCLYPDAYRYRYNEHLVGPAGAEVQLDCAVDGDAPLPDRVPEVVWRAGLDLNPLDVRDDDDLRWLEALIWPEQHHRRSRLRAAAAVARHDPPVLRRGDLVTDLPAFAAEAPPEATLVVFHSAVLGYVPPRRRAAFIRQARDLPGHWISHEAPGVVPGLPKAVAGPAGAHAPFLLALDGVAVAGTAPHGQALRWF
jgi:hypothetical protein